MTFAERLSDLETKALPDVRDQLAALTRRVDDLARTPAEDDVVALGAEGMPSPVPLDTDRHGCRRCREFEEQGAHARADAARRAKENAELRDAATALLRTGTKKDLERLKRLVGFSETGGER